MDRPNSEPQRTYDILQGWGGLIDKSIAMSDRNEAASIEHGKYRAVRPIFIYGRLGDRNSIGNSGSAAMSVINGKNVSINSDLTAECRNPQQFRYVLVLPFPL